MSQAQIDTLMTVAVIFDQSGKPGSGIWVGGRNSQAETNEKTIAFWME